MNHEAAIEGVLKNLLQLLRVHFAARSLKPTNDDGVLDAVLQLPAEGFTEQFSVFVHDDSAASVLGDGRISEGRLRRPLASFQRFLHPVHHALAPGGIFVLTEGEIDVLLQLPARRECLGWLGDGLHRDAALLEFAGNVDRIGTRTRKAVEVIDDNNMDFLLRPLHEVDHPLEFLSLVVFGRFIGAAEEGFIGISASVAMLVAIFQLRVQAVIVLRLFLGGNAGVNYAVDFIGELLLPVMLGELLE